MKVDRKKLFVTFSGLVALLVGKKLRPADLEDGLFFFGCTRKWVHGKEPFQHLKRGRDGAAWRAAHVAVLKELATAEPEGRVFWRDTNEMPHNAKHLMDLLQQNGIAVSSDSSTFPQTFEDHEAMKRMLEAAAKVEVVIT